MAWNKASTNSAKFVLALIQARTANPSGVATAFTGRAKPASHYERAQRLLRLFELPHAQVARTRLSRGAARPP